MIFHSGNGIVADCSLEPAGGIDHAVHVVARVNRLHGCEGEAHVNCDAGYDQVLAPRLLDCGYERRIIPRAHESGRSITGTSGNMHTTPGINGPFGPWPRLGSAP
jgi:hypothetical protein